ncbi:hypothetical protein V8E55_001212 [Tylopilus felleus]
MMVPPLSITHALLCATIYIFNPQMLAVAAIVAGILPFIGFAADPPHHVLGALQTVVCNDIFQHRFQWGHPRIRVSTRSKNVGIHPSLRN